MSEQQEAKTYWPTDCYSFPLLPPLLFTNFTFLASSKRMNEYIEILNTRRKHICIFRIYFSVCLWIWIHWYNFYVCFCMCRDVKLDKAFSLDVRTTAIIISRNWPFSRLLPFLRIRWALCNLLQQQWCEDGIKLHRAFRSHNLDDDVDDDDDSCVEKGKMVWLSRVALRKAQWITQNCRHCVGSTRKRRRRSWGVKGRMQVFCSSDHYYTILLFLEYWLSSVETWNGLLFLFSRSVYFQTAI